MSSPVPAGSSLEELVPDPDEGALLAAADRHPVQWAFETATVTAASNLIEELQRAANPAVLAA
jgi:hypothetical protein